MSDSQTKKRVLSNMAMMRLLDSDLAPWFAHANPSDDDAIDVVVTMTVLEPSTVDLEGASR